jgi:hypothetical protein
MLGAYRQPATAQPPAVAKRSKREPEAAVA